MSELDHCSPAVARQRRPGETCLPTESVNRLVKEWNKQNPESKILGGRKRATRSNGSTLWSNLRHAMMRHYNCNTEYCLVEKMPGLSKEERTEMEAFFRPKKPEEWLTKPTTWLDSFNIEDVMNQYEAAYPHFEFIGPVPIDFDSSDKFGKCIVEELCRLDLKKMAAAGTTQIGIIFNLDKHDEPGSHWVCGFVDIPKSAAYYFDSYGYEPPKEVIALMARLRDQGISNTYYNDIRHQYKGSECGMYCLYTLISLILGKSFYNVCKRIVDDDTMNSLRDILFATAKPRKETVKARRLLESK